MKVYIFHSYSQNVRALAFDDVGDNLPVAYAPWQPLRDRPLLSSNLPAAVFTALLRDGFFLTSDGTRVAVSIAMSDPLTTPDPCPIARDEPDAVRAVERQWNPKRLQNRAFQHGGIRS
jgi:hypothetical protein